MKKESKQDLIDRFIVISDSREQMPYIFTNQQIIRKLDCGDYSLEYNNVSYESKIVVERKRSVGELYSASGKERNRFERELERLAKIEFKWVICEFDFLALVNDPPPGLLEPQAVYGSILSWHIKYNVPFLFCGNRVNSRAVTFKLFQNYVKYKILELVSP